MGLPMGPRYSVHDDPRRDAAAALQVVDEGIGAFNEQEPALADVHPLAVFVHDEAGTTIGGAVGRRWGRAAELQQLWVADAQRRHGLGRELLARFEAQAAAHGVQLVYLETFSFQAPRFYEKQGYHTVLLIDELTRGISKHTMHKRLPVPG